MYKRKQQNNLLRRNVNSQVFTFYKKKGDVYIQNVTKTKKVRTPHNKLNENSVPIINMTPTKWFRVGEKIYSFSVGNY